MYMHFGVVKWPNGELEGSCGFGFTAKEAEDRMRRSISGKIAYVEGRMGVTPKFLTRAEFNKLSRSDKAQIKRDWKVCQETGK